MQVYGKPNQEKIAGQKCSSGRALKVLERQRMPEKVAPRNPGSTALNHGRKRTARINDVTAPISLGSFMFIGYVVPTGAC